MRTETAVKYFGTKSEIAKVLDITKGAVSHWGEYVPKGNAAILELKTNHELKYEPKPKLKKAR